MDTCASTWATMSNTTMDIHEQGFAWTNRFHFSWVNTGVKLIPEELQTVFQNGYTTLQSHQNSETFFLGFCFKY